MSSIFPRTIPAARSAPRAQAAPAASRETHEAARRAVRDLLERSQSFNELAPDKRETLAKGLVQIGSYLAEPDGVRLKQQSPQVRSLADDTQSSSSGDSPEFGQGLKTGVQQAGALLQAVNFPEFVSGLIDGVFNSIVTSSIQQMEAYAKLVADVSKSLDQFRDDNTTQNQGRDHLVEQFPDLFQLQMGGDGGFGGGGFGGDGFSGDFNGGGDPFGGGQAPAEPRVVLRQDVDERAAVARVNQSLPLEQPLTRIDDDVVEALLVPAARTQIATGRQQLLATLVMLGINRIVVTDGRISAKVMYDFQTQDQSHYRNTATSRDYERDAYGNVATTRVPSDSGGPTLMIARPASAPPIRSLARSVLSGAYKYSEQPIIKMTSTSQLANDASLQARASLAGQVEVNFKSDYMPLDKLANPDAIAAIQMNAQPGMVRTVATNRPPPPPSVAPANAPAGAPAPAASAPSATPAPAPAAGA